ncbi:hypothetical protein CHS0354_010800 [Potamilus streckersoni]|uniref:Uncharacterized protein n=1 Tax=Potamilus streckersoni TaxID=2493646 RepID=A0AAE0W998_9BIVA|nr:hypothetical protein CHS0354_010800 [Potamilus streckersoni]
MISGYIVLIWMGFVHQNDQWLHCIDLDGICTLELLVFVVYSVGWELYTEKICLYSLFIYMELHTRRKNITIRTVLIWWDFVAHTNSMYNVFSRVRFIHQNDLSLQRKNSV